MRQFNSVQAARDHVQSALKLTNNAAIQDAVEEATFDIPLELPPQRAFLLALNKSLQALNYPTNPYPYSITASAPAGAYIGDLDGAIANFINGPHNHAAGLPASTDANPQPRLIPLDTPRLWLFIALLADPLTQPLISPRCGLMTISPANMRRVFTPLANKTFPASSHRHAPLRRTPLAAATRTPDATTLPIPLRLKPRPPTPIGVRLDPSLNGYLDDRARAVKPQRVPRGKAACILAQWALTMSPPPVSTVRGRAGKIRTQMLSVIVDEDALNRFQHYADAEGVDLATAVRHLLVWARHIEETTQHKAYIH